MGLRKRYFFWGALAIAGKRRRHVSYANQTALHRRPPFHPSAIFFLPSLSLSRSPCVLRKKRYYIYIYRYMYIYNFRFRCCDIYFETRRRHRREFLDFQKPRIGESSIPSSSPRPAVVLLSSLIDDPDQPLNSSSFPFPSSVAVLLLPGRPPVKQVTIDMIG